VQLRYDSLLFHILGGGFGPGGGGAFAGGKFEPKYNY